MSTFIDPVNAPLLDRVKYHVLAYPGSMDMDTFGNRSFVYDKTMDTRFPSGVLGCIATWSVALHDGHVDTYRSVKSRAREVLWLDHEQGENLFYTGNWPNDLSRAYRRAAMGRNRAPRLKMLAKVVALRIDRYIASNGRDRGTPERFTFGSTELLDFDFFRGINPTLVAARDEYRFDLGGENGSSFRHTVEGVLYVNGLRVGHCAMSIGDRRTVERSSVQGHRADRAIVDDRSDSMREGLNRVSHWGHLARWMRSELEAGWYGPSDGNFVPNGLIRQIQELQREPQTSSIEQRQKFPIGKFGMTQKFSLNPAQAARHDELQQLRAEFPSVALKQEK